MKLVIFCLFLSKALCLTQQGIVKCLPVLTNLDCSLGRITNEVEYEAVKECSHLGGLTINPTKPMKIELLATNLGSGLTIEGNYVVEVKLNHLQNIQGPILIHNVDNLEVVEIQHLTSLAGGIKVENADSLRELKITRLSVILGNLEISNAKSLKELYFLRLGTINGDITLRGLYSMNSAELPMLTILQGSLIVSESNLTQIYLPFLHSLCGIITINKLDNLKQFTAPNLQSYPIFTKIVAPQLNILDLGKMVATTGSTLLDQKNTNIISKYPGPALFQCYKNNYVDFSPIPAPEIKDNNSDQSDSPLRPDDSSTFNFTSKASNLLSPKFIPLLALLLLIN